MAVPGGATAVSLALLLAVAAVASCTSRSREAEKDEPRLELSRSPYMGVACPKASSTACDRIGLAVWFTERPVRVEALVNGRTFALTRPDGYGGDPRGEYVEGYLQPAGLDSPPFDLPRKWEGSPGVSVPVRIEAVDADGRTATFSMHLGLHAGWG